MTSRLRPVLLGGLAAGCVLAFHALGRQYYDDFHVPQRGMEWLLPQELAQAALFGLLGTVALALLTAALLATPLPERLLAVGRSLLGRPWLTAGAAAAVVLTGSLAIRHFVLRGAPICDDENAYRFIAQTLERGALVAPSPGADLAFYEEPFVVLTDKARYGKYPIGHPALLMLGRLLGAEWLVVPMLIVALVLGTLVLGRAVFDLRTGALGAALLALSPQVLATGATWLSQPAAALCLTIALVCLTAMERPGRSPAGWAAAAGLALGYGVLVRPLPGVLFVAAALLHLALEQRTRRYALATWAALLAPLAAAAAVLVLVNGAQTGQALLSAYQAAHGNAPVASFLTNLHPAQRVSSVVGTLIRLDHWFLGWPLALGLCALARNGRARLLWAVIAAELVYRVVSPKVGVGTAGPLYMFEAFPALALLAADGLRQVAAGRWRLAALLPGARLAPSLLVAGSFVAVTMFLPPRLGTLATAGNAHRVVDELLAAHRIDRALVFHEYVVPPLSGRSWAYGPRTNSPALDDAILFVKFWPGQPEENRKFWRRRHPDRRALYFGYQRGHPFLADLDQYIDGLRSLQRRDTR